MREISVKTGNPPLPYSYFISHKETFQRALSQDIEPVPL